MSERIRHVEELHAADRQRTGSRVLGRKTVLSQRWSDRPGTSEPRRELSPRIAARNKWRRIEAILRNKAFRDAYKDARERFVRGIRDVLFPPGTYWLRRFARALCACDPAPA